MYALVEIKGKQFKVTDGDVIRVDLMDEEPGKELEFGNVMLIRQDSDLKIGTPYLEDARIVAKVCEHIADKKVTVIKFKRRKGYRRKQGHRQKYTVLQIDKIINA